MEDKGKNVESDQFNNTEYISDAQFAIQIARYHLKPLGLWPAELTKSLMERIFSYFLIIASLFFILFYMIPVALFILIIVKESALQLQLTGALSFSIMGIAKYSSLLIKQHTLTLCINHVNDDWQRVDSNSNRNIMLAYAQYGRYGSLFCATLMYGSALFYAGILPQVSAAPVNEFNETMRKLPYVGYYIWFDPQKSPIYEIIFVLHCFCAYVLHSITSTTFSIAVIFIVHACGQLEIIMTRLSNFVDNQEDLHGSFLRIVDHHVRTLRSSNNGFKFINCTDYLLREICIVDLIGCTLNICLLGYDILFEWSRSGAVAIVTFLILLLSMIFNIFIFCFIGEFLKEQCEKIGYTTYMIEWYELPKNHILGLTLLISAAQNPPVITAGKMFDLSISTFAAVMKTSVAYLNLLRTVME